MNFLTCCQCNFYGEKRLFLMTQDNYFCFECVKRDDPDQYDQMVVRIDKDNVQKKRNSEELTLSAEERVMMIETMKRNKGKKFPQKVSETPEFKAFANQVQNSNKEKKPNVIPMQNKTYLSAKEIYEMISQSVIGQDDAKKTVALAISDHFKRLDHPHIQKSNILLIGPSGTGKTELFRAISKAFDIPMASTDATSLTAAGFIGMDVDQVLVNLIESAGGDIEKAERGIVFIDELDKVAGNGQDHSSVNTTRVQSELLKMIEGNEVKISVNGDRQRPQYQTINTDNILFVCAGAFAGLQEQLEQKESRSVGISSLEQSEDPRAWQEKVDTQVLAKFGMKQELLGRLPVLAFTNALTPEEMVRILTEPKNSIIKQYQDLLKIDKVDLQFEDQYLMSVAKKAINGNIGVRGLRSILEKELKDLRFDVKQYEDEMIVFTTKGIIKVPKRKLA